MVVQISKGDIKIEQISTIRVATQRNSEKGNFYTCDNRRLFVFRVLDIDEVKVEWIEWTAEFDDKLKQNIRFDSDSRFFFKVGKEDILAYRNDFLLGL